MTSKEETSKAAKVKPKMTSDERSDAVHQAVLGLAKEEFPDGGGLAEYIDAVRREYRAMQKAHVLCYGVEASE